MNKSEIIVKGLPLKSNRLENGDVNLLFKIGTYDDTESIYKVTVKKDYWKDAVEGMKNINYFVIKGELKACVNAKGNPFISIEATSVKTFRLLKDENGQIDLNFEMPTGTDEIIDISKLVNENENLPKRSTNKAINYMKNNNKFNKPIIVKKDSLVIVSGYDQYAAAQELGISNVPVSYVE